MAIQEHTHDLLLKDVILAHHIINYLPAVLVDNKNLPLTLLESTWTDSVGLLLQVLSFGSHSE